MRFELKMHYEQKIVRVGTSSAVIVPRLALRALRWREGNRVTVRVNKRGVVITRTAPSV